MIHAFLGRLPEIPDSCYVAPSADIMGDVALGEYVSVWFNATLRGDVHKIRVGAGTNIQDNACVHVTRWHAPTSIGRGCTIGHGAIIHGCTLSDLVLVGMGATILDDAHIGRESLIGANALVTARMEIPPRSLVLGSPAKVVRSLTDAEVSSIHNYARGYLAYSAAAQGKHVGANLEMLLDPSLSSPPGRCHIVWIGRAEIPAIATVPGVSMAAFETVANYRASVANREATQETILVMDSGDWPASASEVRECSGWFGGLVLQLDGLSDQEAVDLALYGPERKAVSLRPLRFADEGLALRLLQPVGAWIRPDWYE